MRHFPTAFAAAAIGTLLPVNAQTLPPPGAGEYKMDHAHSSLLFRVSHLGFSHYTARFTKFDATMNFDPKNAAAASITATVDPSSLEVSAPPEGFLDELKGKQFLDVATYPEMKFVSTKIEVTGENTGKVTGDFTFHGVTKPVTLDVTFNGGYAGIPGMDPNARAGFSAHGTLNRSEFGMGYGIPSLATGGMGVSDEVEIIIETEFTGPSLPAAPQ